MNAQAKTTPVTTPGAATVSARSLYQALFNVSVCRSKDEARPILCGVLLEMQAREIRFVATDSFKLGTDIVGFDAQPDNAPEGRVLISGPDVDALLQALKPACRGNAPVLLECAAPTEDAPALLNVAVGALRLRIVDLDATHYPDWKNLFQTSLEKIRESSGAVCLGLNPVNLAALTKVRAQFGEKLNTLITQNSTMVFRFPSDPAAPVLVEVGPTFRALLMPVRIPFSEPVAKPPAQVTELAAAAQEAADFMSGGALEQNRALALAEQLREAAAVIDRMSTNAGLYSADKLGWIEKLK